MDLSARGKKRRCLECEEAFYDLNRNPAPCPHCGHMHPLEVFVAGKRPPPPPPKPAAVEEDDGDDEDVIDEDDDDAVIGDDDLDDDDDDEITKVGPVPTDDDD